MEKLHRSASTRYLKKHFQKKNVLKKLKLTQIQKRYYSKKNNHTNVKALLAQEVTRQEDPYENIEDCPKYVQEAAKEHPKSIIKRNAKDGGYYLYDGGDIVCFILNVTPRKPMIAYDPNDPERKKGIIILNDFILKMLSD